MENLTPAERAQCKALINKIQNLPAEIQRICAQGRLVASDPSQLFMFKGMFKELKPYFDKFNQIWEQLVEFCLSFEIPDVFPLQEHKSLQQATKKYYYEACAIYEDHMNPTPSIVTPVNNTTINESKVYKAQLPRINLPEFSGNPLEWPLFRDTFTSLIHDDESISSIDKFHFLASSLKGPALSIIKGIPFMEKNYSQAWTLLKDQFNDRRRLACSYLNTVLDYKPPPGKPTASTLKQFINVVAENISAFQQLKISDSADFVLLYLALRGVNSTTRQAFEREYAQEEFPKYQQLINFVKLEWRTLDFTTEEKRSWEYASPTSGSSYRSKTSLFVQNNTSKFSTGANSRQQKSRPKGFKNNNYSCPICKVDHSLYQCSTFRQATPTERITMLKDWRGCTNCLSSQHNAATCPSTRTCRVCQQHHHSWLHPSQRENATAQPNSGPSTELGPNRTSLTSLSRRGETILGTALAEIKDRQGNFHKIRIVTDGGSQNSYITEACAKRLGLPIITETEPITGIGQVTVSNQIGRVICTIRSSRGSSSELHTEGTVLREITGPLPHSIIPPGVREQYFPYPLADPTFWKPGKIEFLLGGDLFFDIITGVPLVIDTQSPKLLPTIFGHIVAGRGTNVPRTSQTKTLFSRSHHEDIKIILERFWETEKVSSQPIVSPDDTFCDNHYLSTYSRLPSGRFMVSLPFKESINKLKGSRSQAMSRLLSLEHKLNKNVPLRIEYHKFMKEYLDLGHMRKMSSDNCSYVIPHHAVAKWVDGHMKLRVVFDASCRTQTGSLNDYLYIGPKLQLDICDIILNFRLHQVVFTADIVKMYRQILVNPADRKYLRIFWRFSPTEEVSEYELCTVTYGLSSSPFLALRTISQLVKEEGLRYPRAAQALQEDIYVDDVVTGAASLSEALELQKEVRELLDKGCFPLSKWASNRPELLEAVNAECTSRTPVSLSTEQDGIVKVLGLQWIPAPDIFTYQVRSSSSATTKRSILSTIARLYDPLGYLSPIIFYAKTILQETWQAKCDWDEQCPSAIGHKWLTFVNQMGEISHIQIPRCLTYAGSTVYTLIGFSDASKRGYSACIYLKASSDEGCKVNLLRAKSKLAPTKPMSIPRLELMGALLLSRLVESCKRFQARIIIHEMTLFTDSTVVIGWLSTEPHRLKTFVGHRVVAILEHTEPHNWQHIRSEENPADCSSRGLLPRELAEHSLWWAGPDWLKNPRKEWPLRQLYTTTNLPELKPDVETSLISAQISDRLNWMERCSTYSKLIRAVAYLSQFIGYLKNPPATCKGALTVQDLREACKICIRLVQFQYFGKQLSAQKFRSLTPFIDKEGIVRVGGRLENSLLPYEVKHPILLPNNCHFTVLLVDHFHQMYLHLGSSALQAMIQSKYWIISARKLIRSRIFKCITCYKSKQRPKQPLMGDLPPCRVQRENVFTHVGVDFGGPFYIRQSLRRKAALGKAYLCLFIFMTTKALH